jgi:hypothetical protein
MMAENQSSPDTMKIVRHFLRGDEQRRVVEGQPLSPEMALLRNWQSERLKHTYADLLKDEWYAPACRFFLSDIYAPVDFSQRDQDLEQIHDWLRRFLPESVLWLVRDSLYLNQLTAALDEKLLGVLVGELGISDSISEAQYVEAYRRCDNYDERLAQIDLLVKVAKEVGEVAHIPLTGLLIRNSRKTIQAIGWGEMHDRLERGQVAFSKLPRVRWFANTIEKREKQILDRIYNGEKDVFERW